MFANLDLMDYSVLLVIFWALCFIERKLGRIAEALESHVKPKDKIIPANSWEKP